MGNHTKWVCLWCALCALLPGCGMSALLIVSGRGNVLQKMIAWLIMGLTEMQLCVLDMQLCVANSGTSSWTR